MKLLVVSLAVITTALIVTITANSDQGFGYTTSGSSTIRWPDGWMEQYPIEVRGTNWNISDSELYDVSGAPTAKYRPKPKFWKEIVAEAQNLKGKRGDKSTGRKQLRAKKCTGKMVVGVLTGGYAWGALRLKCTEPMQTMDGFFTIYRSPFIPGASIRTNGSADGQDHWNVELEAPCPKGTWSWIAAGQVLAIANDGQIVIWKDVTLPQVLRC